MRKPPRKPFGFLFGALAAIVAIAAASLVPAAQPSDGIDALITGSVATPVALKLAPTPAPMPAALAETKGSSAFRLALASLKAGDEAAAFTLGAALKDGLERRTIEWAAIYYGAGDVPYGDVQRFMKDAPDFASPGVFKTRIEQALIKADAGSAEIIKNLSGAMPNTLDAQIALASAYVDDGQKARAAAIARDIWIDNVLDRASEAKMLKALGGLLTAKDHWARAQHLMMQDQVAAVERLLPKLTKAQKTLAVARNATSRNAKDAKKLLDAVDPAYKTNPIYYFSRAERARQFELWDDAIGYLNKGRTTDPEPAEWWYERQTLVRQLLAKGDAKRAYIAAAGYTDGPEGRVVEAQFHAGWIALSFLNDAKAAAGHFGKMAGLSTLPDSVTQAQYWLGRARTALGDKAGAKTAFVAAAQYTTLYYGILAREALGLKPVELRGLPSTIGSDSSFDKNEVVRAVRLLAANGETTMAQPLLRNFASGLTDGGELLLAARLAQAIDAHNLAILIADNAEKRGAPLDLFSFPKDGLPVTKLAEVDKAAVYAITRQESHFQIDAISRSGARGLMQLMPQTAKETAAKIGVAYSQQRLTTDGAYNAQLGSAYLRAQLERFGGSLVLAAAAYNAGGGNASKWITAYGDPRADNVDPVVWVELIPFAETRKYVQRVLGNYLVYRARLGHAEIGVTQALRSIL